MAMSGSEKEMRMRNSWSSDSLDHNHHTQQDHPDHFPTTGSLAGAQAMPISVGSKLRSPTRYRECLKNHAASMGGNVTDGCGEFMPSGDDGTIEALKCAACNCHRNFHRKEPSSAAESADFSRMTAVHPLQLPLPLPSPSTNKHRNIHLGMHSNHWSSISPVKMAFGGGGGGSAATDSSSEEMNFNAGSAMAPPFGSAKKRFRTKFTQEQKEKMMEFAEKVGWRIPREDDVEVQRFCGEIGVKRHVFKVWMHNNKSNVASGAAAAAASGAAASGSAVDVKNKQGQESYGD